MFVQIINGAPIWVWPLLVGLIFLGLRATQSRTTPYMPTYFYWLLGILPINAVNSFSPAPIIWIAFVAFYLLGAGLAFQFQRRIIVTKAAGRMTLKGEWVTLIVFMTVFWMNFAGGVVEAISPETYASAGFHIIFATIAGLAAGSFIGRALQVFLTRSLPKALES